MGLITWSDDKYEVQYAGETIVLLPKEYALLHFLFTGKNRTFSRENLLDRVWALEEPTDRTVDDHIYRLRKKLQKWSHLFTIDTVRGIGYRLTWKLPPQQALQPDVLNRGFSESIQKMLTTYHGMGMGAAMQTLSANQEVLGFRMDPFYAMYMRFITGDFAWFVEDKTAPMGDKLFYLFHLYHMTEPDSRKTLDVYQRVLRDQAAMPATFQDELQVNAIALYARAGEWELARQQVSKARKIVESLNSQGFILFLQAEETILAILSDQIEEAEEIIRRSKEILLTVPMQRELGSFTLMQGICMYRREQYAKARRLIDEGIEVIRATQFVPHLIYAINNILLFFQIFDCDQEWEHKYQKIWDALSEEYQFDYMKKSILCILPSSI
ncbi:winged helix-turn-helix domain-containing protein [uncultured Brevibacillus sp.]|uniref:winged helix-turn-helix domain-containing protein n=1 Tax=uncultured Brevibacillus sp. TaxID=169970 RepID=UPI0025983894|nr:winged helix-turn-helix domain-containing protein [uncultured Brevibacillus sp.]